MGSRRDHLARYAADTQAKVERRLNEAEARGWNVRELRRRLRLLGEVLAELEGDARKAA